jgi:transposase
MTRIVSGKELLPDRVSLALLNVEKGEWGCLIEAVATENAACPDCGVRSTARHSSYVRHLKDLPMQGLAVKMKLRVSRWRCRNPGCERQIFCQRLTNVTHKHGRETKRFGEVVRLMAYALGGRPGERLSSRLGLRVSNDTLLRRIKQWAKSRPPTEGIPVVGVDDWAWRKGFASYGTILVDLKRRKVAELLPERSSASFEQWLRQHPEVSVISRDRHGLYAEGGRRGAPGAKQVADRFHLIHNLLQAVEEELAHQRPHLLMPAQELVLQNEVENAAGTPPTVRPTQPRGPLPSATQQQKEVRHQRWQQKVELFQMVKGLYAQGRKASEIVRATGISRGRVDTWLRLVECPPLRNKMAPRPGMAEYLREELQRLWNQGCQNGRKLLIEIRKLGYIGSYTSLNRFLVAWREEKRAARRTEAAATQPTGPAHSAVSAMRHVSPQMAAALLSKPKPQLSTRQSEIIEFLKHNCPDFGTMRHLVLSFRSILCGGKAASLKRWVEEAEAAGIEGMSRFVRQLKKDWAAVENAVEHVWSNGPIEGHINRLKTLKRQMYGRAGVELLRARLLPLSSDELHQT